MTTLCFLNTVLASLLAACSPSVLVAPARSAGIIRAAERFVLLNGYTNTPADKSAIAYESTDLLMLGPGDNEEMQISKLLATRRGTLRPCASGIKRGRKGDDFGWLVGFEFAEGSRILRRFPEMRNTSGRAVLLDEDGSHMRMRHSSWPVVEADENLSCPVR